MLMNTYRTKFIAPLPAPTNYGLEIESRTPIGVEELNSAIDQAKTCDSPETVADCLSHLLPGRHKITSWHGPHQITTERGSL